METEDLIQRNARKRSSDAHADVMESLKAFRKEVLGEIRLLKNSMNLLIEKINDATASISDRVLIKIPLAKNIEEFQTFGGEIVEPWLQLVGDEWTPSTQRQKLADLAL